MKNCGTLSSAFRERLKDDRKYFFLGELNLCELTFSRCFLGFLAQIQITVSICKF
jgi:hypothetical protein